MASEKLHEVREKKSELKQTASSKNSVKKSTSSLCLRISIDASFKKRQNCDENKPKGQKSIEAKT